MSPFDSPEALESALAQAGYIASLDLATLLFIAHRLGRPVMLEGPAGVGKTEVAKALSRAANLRLIRLQCYEGLDEGHALYEWSYAKQLLYSQMLRARLDRDLAAPDSLADAVAHLDAEGRDAFFSEAFLLPRPLLEAIRSDEQVVLLIDEIDRADEAFEAFLLEILSDFQVTIPELGTITAKHRPLVVATSNATRPLSEALRRRCLFHFMDYPDPELESRIVALKVPHLDENLRKAVIRFVTKLREEPLTKLPSVAETLDWAATLVALHLDALDRETIRTTLGVLLKNRDDLERIRARYER